MTRLARLIAAALAALAAATATPAQTLYSNFFFSPELLTVDPANGMTLTNVGAFTAPDGVNLSTALAFDAATETMYVVYQNGSGGWVLGTIDLATAAITPVGATEAIRGLVFDDTGTLWGVTGQNADPIHGLVTVNTATGVVTTQNGALPSISNKIAFNTATGELCILGDESGTIILYCFDPATPAQFTFTGLSGDSGDLVGTAAAQPGFVYDPSQNLYLTDNAGDWATITPGGAVSYDPTPIPSHGGLAFGPGAPVMEQPVGVLTR